MSEFNNISGDTMAENQVEMGCMLVYFLLGGKGAKRMRRHSGHRHGGFQCCHADKFPAKLFSEYNL